MNDLQRLKIAVDHPEPAEPLTTISIRASNLLSRLAEQIDPNDNCKSALVNELWIFELWAVNLGVYHCGHSSLDYRFRDSPHLFNYICRSIYRRVSFGPVPIEAGCLYPAVGDPLSIHSASTSENRDLDD